MIEITEIVKECLKFYHIDSHIFRAIGDNDFIVTWQLITNKVDKLRHQIFEDDDVMK